MKKVASISEIVDEREVPSGTREVFATAEASFDETKHQLVVELDSYVLVTDSRGHDTRVTENWLPRKEIVREGMDVHDAPDAAKDIFRSWAVKVRRGVPSPGSGSGGGA